MITTDIPREQWATFCQRFTGQHNGGLVTVMAQGPDGHAQELAHTLQLVSLAAGAAGDVAMTLSKRHGEHETQTVQGVRRMVFVQNAAGAHLGLDLVTGDQTITLRFRVPVLPETVDGLVQA